MACNIDAIGVSKCSSETMFFVYMGDDASVWRQNWYSTKNLPISMTWEKIKPIVKGIRKQLNKPKFYSWFEYLYNEMQKREQRLQQTQQ